MKIAGLARTLAAFVLVNGLSMSAAKACSADPFATFSDDFKTPNPQWPVEDSLIYFADGQLAIKPAPGRSMWASIQSYRYNSAVICLDVKGPPAKVASSSVGAGLIFNKFDNANFIVAVLYEFGTYLLAQLVNNAWRTIDTSNKLKKFNVGAGATNEIKVSLRPSPKNSSTMDGWVIINDEIVSAPLTISRIAGGGSIGAYAELPPDSAREWRFSRISATPQIMKPESRYTLAGTDGAGQSYTGTVYAWEYIYNDNDTESYKVIWEVGEKKTIGIGILRGNEFSVSYTDGATMGAAVLTPSDTGWTGKRFDTGSGAHLATETWVRK